MADLEVVYRDFKKTSDNDKKKYIKDNAMGFIGLSKQDGVKNNYYYWKLCNELYKTLKNTASCFINCNYVQQLKKIVDSDRNLMYLYNFGYRFLKNGLFYDDFIDYNDEPGILKLMDTYKGVEIPVYMFFLKALDRQKYHIDSLSPRTRMKLDYFNNYYHNYLIGKVKRYNMIDSLQQLKLPSSERHKICKLLPGKDCLREKIKHGMKKIAVVKTFDKRNIKF